MIRGLEKATPSMGSVEGTHSLQACRNPLMVTSSCEKAVETLAKNLISHRHLGKSDHTREPCLGRRNTDSANSNQTRSP